MSSVDDRVVAMKFDASQFGAGVSTTIGILDKLKASLNFSKEQKGLQDLSASAGRFNMGNIGTTIEGINGKLLAMGTIGVTALANITNKAINAGTQITKSLTISPLQAGFQEYSTNLNSIQTILANTAAAGTDLKDVNKALDQLNTYSDQTIYNFGQMAKNIGTFTAAGVDLETSVQSIKGISNLAALSGSSAEQASSAMYQLSQALSAGRVSLQDWNSVVNAGMGGAVFQRALAQTAEKMGTLDAGAVKLTGKMKNATINGQSFRESITAKPGEESWLTSDVLTKTLEQFTGDMTDAQLKAQGFNAEQIKAIQLQAKNAKDAATQVKTLGQAIDVAKETMGSGWAQTWRLIFGDFEEAKGTFTELSNTINGAINRFSDARNKVLKDWKKLGGRDVLIQGLVQGFQALMDLLSPISKAFRDIFPAKTGADLYNLTVRFRDFMSSLKLNEGTMDNIRRIFRGIFAVLDIGITIIKGVAGVFGDMFAALGEGSGGFLNFAGGIGDMLVNLRDAIKQGEGLNKFFQVLGTVISAPIKALGKFAGFMSQIFGSRDAYAEGTSGLAGGFDKLSESLNPLQRLMQGLSIAWERFGQALGSIGNAIQRVVPGIADALSGIGDALANNFSGENFDRVLDTINTGLLAGIALLIKKFFSSGIKVDLGQMGFMEKLGGVFDGLTGHINAMTQQVKAKTLLMIAGAIAILTASVVVLSLIDSAALTRALGAMTAAFAQLLVAMGIMTKMSGLKGFLKVPAVAASMILLAGAILVLSLALKVIATMSWEELAKGLAGLAAMLTILSLAVIPLSKAEGPMLRSAVAIGLLGGAILLLALGMKIFATMNWEEMGKGLTGVVGSLTAIAVAMRLMPKGMLAQAAAILAIGVALNAIAAAMKIFATMSWQEMAKGLTATLGSIAAIALAMQLMPKGMLIQAVALIAVATALNILAGALKIMASMSWEEIGKGLVTLAGALVILAGGLYLMSGTLAGAAALLVAAGALAILTPVLLALGNMSWESIIKGLATLAGAFIIIGLAGLVLTPIVPTILALGAAIALIGVGVGLAGAGILAFSAALTALVALGTAGIAVLAAVLTALIALIPDVLIAFANGILDMVDVIGNGAPRIVAAFVKIMNSLLEAVIRLTPKIVDAVEALLRGLLKLIVDMGPAIFRAGLDLIIGFLEAIRDKIPEVAKVVGEIVVAFIVAFSTEIPKIVEAGIKGMVDFINGMADAIRLHSGEVGSAIENLIESFVQLGKDIVKGFIKGLLDSVGLGAIGDAAGGLVGAAEGGVKLVGKIFSPSKLFIQLGKFLTEGFAIGLRDTADVEEALGKMKDLIKSTFDDAKTEIQNQKRKIEELNSRKRTPANSAGIDKQLKEANKALLEAQNIRTKTAAAAKLYNKDLKDEQQRLLALSVAYEDVTQKLKNAQDELQNAIDVRDSFQENIQQQYSVLPGIEDDTTLDTYSDAIRKATADNLKFKATLEQLRNLGLDDLTYKKFLEEGVGAQGFLDDLVSAGRSQVDEIDRITAELDKSAGDLGTQTSRELYQAGVNAAQGIVDGLASQQLVIEGQMDKIAQAMVAAIKKQLGIKSPSKVFEEIAKFSMEGLGTGFDKYGNIVKLAAVDVGDLAMAAMKDSMARLAEVIPSTIDHNPVIAPVLDLTQLRASAVGLNDILAPRDVSVNVSYDRASVLALETAATKKAQDEFIEQSLVAGDTLVYTQNNTSPKALSSAEIYRQTRNQLSVVKGALPK